MDGIALRWERERTSYGDVADVFDLLADAERWPLLLPHVRSVVCEEETAPGQRRIRVVYQPWGVALRCSLALHALPAQGQVEWLHLAGHGVGLREVWHVSPKAGGARIGYACSSRGAAARVSGPAFVRLAERTAAMVDLLAEAERHSREWQPG